MCTSHSSVSYWSQMKVTLLAKSSLVLVFAMFLGLETQAIHTSPVQVQRDFKKLAHCNFFVSEKNNSVRDILECMNELASQQIAGKKNSRAAEKRSGFFSATRDIDANKPYEYNPYSTYPEIQNNFYNKLNIMKRGPQHSGHRPNLYGYPPALPPSYPMPSNADFRPGILGVNLLDALSSISQYDDRKCVPRILCEVATGVKPGSSGYKQNYSDFGMNSIISLLTALTPGTSSPLIAFGKSALMGYANKGNPDICYRQYPHCPRNPSDLVDYLNNHNGGFFRFFNNRYGATRDFDKDNGDNINDDDDEPQYENQYSDDYSGREINNSEADETSLIKTINDNEDNNKKITFPEEEKSNRASIYSDNHDTPSFFPQNRTSQEYRIKNNNEKQLLKLPETKIYHSDNLASQKPASNTFPTRQKLMMNSEFTKLVLDDDKASNKDSLTHIKFKSINFQQFEMINMAKLYFDNEKVKSKIQQPCNMICNDSHNNTVQFEQYITTAGLTTKKIPDGSILDLSNQLLCQVICQNISYDDERQLSTPLYIVLQPNKYEESIRQEMIFDKNAIIINEKNDNIKRILMTESLVPHSGVSLVDLAGEHGILQRPKYIEPRPPVLIDEQGASHLMPLGVLLFRRKVFDDTDPSSSTVYIKEEKKIKKTSSFFDTIKNLSVITTTLDKDIFLNYNMKGKTTNTRVREKKNSIDMTQINRSPEGEDYPQGSCLENESKGLNDDEDNMEKNKDNSKMTTKIPLNKKPGSKTSVRKNDNVQQFMIQIPQANIEIKAVNIC